MGTRITPLYEYHKSNGTIAEYAGFKMPLWYRGAVEEHLSVRNTGGLFDVSHMGRITVVGEEAGSFLDYVLTINCTSSKSLQARHAFLCTSKGGILDDIMLFKLDETRFLLIVNASNTEKDLNWLSKHASAFQAHITDITHAVPMIAIQGPTTVPTLQALTQFELTKLKRFHAAWVKLLNASLLLSRTGYTGEDGFELFMFSNGGETGYPLQLWHQILKSGQPCGIEPCGLAARDTLRLEAGLCLNGNELSEETTPIETHLEHGIDFKNHSFIGKTALQEQLQTGVNQSLVGFKLFDRGIPRKGMDIIYAEKAIGKVTSGTFSPVLKIGIGLGFVASEYGQLGQPVKIRIRQRLVNAEIVKMPFYDEERYGWRRRN